MRTYKLINLLFIFLLAGCDAISTSVINPIQATATLPATPMPTKHATVPTSTQDLQAMDHSITSTAIVEAVLSAELPRIYKSYPSPDGKWRVEITIYDCVKVDTRSNADANAYEQLQLLNASGGKELIDSQLQNCGGLGAAGLDGLYWSSNSRYFYYTNARDGVPDGCGYWEKPILRLNTDTLKTANLGGGPNSPDGTKIITWQGNELVIWDKEEGIELGHLSPRFPNIGTGPIAWSPNSQAFVYVQTESYCPLSGKSYIVHVDSSTLEQTILLESESPTFSKTNWDVLKELRLFDENGKPWIYKFESQELKPLP